MSGRLAAAALLAGYLTVGTASHVHAQDADDPVRVERWKGLQHAIFGDRSMRDGSALLDMDAPSRALDAALVPLTIRLKGATSIKGIYLVIDDNPGPLAGHFTFGPQSDPRTLKLRVRVNAYTYVHAVAETQDDQLYSIARFVKAAGGCSAPAGADEQTALQNLGQMRLHLLEPFVAGKPLQAQLMIRHPNFNGMQMDQLTRMYTPARFIRSVDVTYNDANVMHLDSDISLSTDPVITFGFVPSKKGELKVIVQDTKDTTFGEKFPVPAPAG